MWPREGRFDRTVELGPLPREACGDRFEGCGDRVSTGAEVLWREEPVWRWGVEGLHDASVLRQQEGVAVREQVRNEGRRLVVIGVERER